MDAFANKLVENTFLPFFAMSTDVTDISEFVLKTGCLWRYVRASMSVIGITPPVVDRGVSDHLLVDGGYVNNVPTGVMKQVGEERGWDVAVSPGCFVYFVCSEIGPATDPEIARFGERAFDVAEDDQSV